MRDCQQSLWRGHLAQPGNGAVGPRPEDAAVCVSLNVRPQRRRRSEVT